MIKEKINWSLIVAKLKIDAVELYLDRDFINRLIDYFIN